MPFYGTNPSIINFVNISTSEFTTFAWNFGDGNTSTDENPQNTYSADGTYTVTFTATSGDGLVMVYTDFVVIGTLTTGYVEPERGYIECPGVNPMVHLRISNDGGKTWITMQPRSAGRTGEYNRRVRWNRLGMGRRRVFEVTVSDPYPWKITGAYLKAEPEGQGR